MISDLEKKKQINNDQNLNTPCVSMLVVLCFTLYQIYPDMKTIK